MSASSAKDIPLVTYFPSLEEAWAADRKDLRPKTSVDNFPFSPERPEDKYRPNSTALGKRRSRGKLSSQTSRLSPLRTPNGRRAPPIISTSEKTPASSRLSTPNTNFNRYSESQQPQLKSLSSASSSKLNASSDLKGSFRIEQQNPMSAEPSQFDISGEAFASANDMLRNGEGFAARRFANEREVEEEEDVETRYQIECEMMQTGGYKVIGIKSDRK
jgi:hypothetical protein